MIGKMLYQTDINQKKIKVPVLISHRANFSVMEFIC